MLDKIELYILLFFTYSFAGWFMESFGGIFKEKKLINRGFLIGPYCPVYGVGVVAITILLSKYTNDLPILFILSILICGTLEYSTSYIMEKLFHARWWDYKNKKFNINGRICLETLIPFGIVGTLILYYVNPFFENIYMEIPSNIRMIITAFLSIVFVIDMIVSFTIISSFKGEIFASKDNTEEISNKVKDKTEEAFEKAETDVKLFGRKLKLKSLQLERKARYTRNKISTAIVESPRELAEKINKQREFIQNKVKQEKIKIASNIKVKRAQYELKQKEQKMILSNIIDSRKRDLKNFSKEKGEKLYNNIVHSTEDITKIVRENFIKQSMLRRRLMEAFPKLEIKNEKDKNKK